MCCRVWAFFISHHGSGVTAACVTLRISSGIIKLKCSCSSQHNSTMVATRGQRAAVHGRVTQRKTPMFAGLGKITNNAFGIGVPRLLSLRQAYRSRTATLALKKCSGRLTSCFQKCYQGETARSSMPVDFPRLESVISRGTALDAQHGAIALSIS